MNCKPLLSHLSAFLLLIFASASGKDIYALKTKYLRLIYYSKNHAYVVPHLARCFENSLQFHRRLFHYTPTEEVVVFLNDFSDFGHAGTSTMPWNRINIGIEPFEYVYETMPANERMNWLMHHELSHVVAIDKASRRDRFFRAILGGKVSPLDEHPVSMFYSYLTNPRWYSPRWFHEGTAVFLETWMAGGLGRGLGGYDEMVFRTMVRDSSYFYDVVGLESEGKTSDFQVGQNSYLYGTRFVSYLAYHYGPEKILQWLDRNDGSQSYFAGQFRKLFDASLDDEWSRWIKWEHAWQRANLDSIRLYPLTPYRAVTQRALGSVSRAFYDSTRRQLYVAVNYPGQLAHIAAIDLKRGAMEKICDVPTPALYYVSALAYDQAAGNLFFTTDNSYEWRDLSVVNLKTRQVRRLMKNSRIGALVFNAQDSTLWGVRHHQGLSSLVRLAPPYRDWQEIFSLPYGKDIFDLDISPDGRTLIASFVEVSGRQSLIKMEMQKLRNGDGSYETLFEFENNAPENFVFSPDGKYLFGTSYYTGVSNVFRYDLTNKTLEAVSNAETGFFRPVPIAKNLLIVFRYTGKGFIPVFIPLEPRSNVNAIRYLGQQIVKKHPVVKEWSLPPPTRINLDSLTLEAGKYQPLRHLKLASAYPVVEGYKDFAAFGWRFDFLDPLLLHNLDLTATYTPNQQLPQKEKLHLRLNYHHWPWELNAAYNAADFYDLFGPTKTSRKGYELALQYNNFLLDDFLKKMDYTFHLAGYRGLERLPEFQNVATSFDKFISFQAKLNYNYWRRTIGGVEPEQGANWQLIAQNNYVSAKHFSRLYTNFDFGKLLPLAHSSLWLRSSAGYAFGGRKEPFANFYFGGFGNNWVDHAEANRYREYYSFPGVALNNIGGSNYGKLTLEWTLPPVRFRRVGLQNLYCTWSRLALFSSGLATNFDRPHDQRKLLNVGTQLDFRLVLFSLLDSTFSLGYAVAAEKERRLSHELMVSLKILE